MVELQGSFEILTLQQCEEQKITRREDLPSFTPNRHKRNLRESHKMERGSVLPYGKSLLYVYERQGHNEFEWLRRGAFKKILGQDESIKFEKDWGISKASEEVRTKIVMEEECTNDERLCEIINRLGTLHKQHDDEVRYIMGALKDVRISVQKHNKVDLFGPPYSWSDK